MRTLSLPLGIAGVGCLILLSHLCTLAADAPTTAPAAGPMQRVKWIGKTADWADGANWSTGQPPTAGDIAVFNLPANKIAHQPDVSGTVQVGGIVFASWGGNLTPHIPGSKNGIANIPGATWTITGKGVIQLGRGGITTGSTDIIYPAVELTGPQTWAVGGNFIDPSMYETWADTIGFNPANLVLCGPITGVGPLTKTCDGKVFYCTNSLATFTGGTRILGGWIDWAPVGLAAAQPFVFGGAPITLDNGYFSFGAAMCKDKNCFGDLANPIIVGRHGGRLYYSQEGPGPKTPDTYFTGPISLGGRLIIEHTTSAGGASNIELTGPITVDQHAPANPVLSLDGNYSTLLLRGPIGNGDGNAGNPLLLQSVDCALEVMNPANTFDGLTVIGICGGQAFDIITNSGVVDIAANSRLGNAGVILEPGGRLNLNSSDNLPAGASVSLRSNPLALSALSLTYDGLPALTADSDGVIAIDTMNFEVITDLSKIGDGKMWLGSRDQGTFIGKTLAPGAGNIYRLGGGSFGGVPGRGWPKNAFPLQSGAAFGDYLSADHWLRHNPSFMDPTGNPGSAVGEGLLTIQHGVLAGDASVDIGSTQWLGNIAVVLEGANSFTGDLRVAGPMQNGFQWGFCGRGSLLEGVAQTQAGLSPFGSPAGKVYLQSSTIKLTAVPNGQPVQKGALAFAGNSTVALDANIDNSANLTFNSLDRTGRAVLDVDPQQEKLGDSERLVVDAWKKDVDLLPPYFLYASTKEWAPVWGKKGIGYAPDRTTGPDFLAYDATGGKGVLRYSNYKTDLAAVTDADVVRAGKTKLPPGNYTVRALNATGAITGKGASLKITSGGLITSADIAPDIDFGSAEGIIFGSNLKPAANQQSSMITLSGKISGTAGLTLVAGPLPWGYDFAIPAQNGIVLANPNNDFTGPITVEGAAVRITPDIRKKGGIVHGSLGAVTNPVTLDGGILTLSELASPDDYLAPTRTITLAAGGGYLHAGRLEWLIDSAITGPGFLGQTNEGGGTIVIDNPRNDYSGGTLVGYRMRVTRTGVLGTGPVMTEPDTVLTLQGDANINPNQRLTVSHSATASFESARPTIGSLDGSGLVWLGSNAQQPPRKGIPPAITLTLGGDNTDSTFFGAIRQGPGITGSLTKTGAGTFTLFGIHDYAGPTTVSAGTLIVAGGVAGDVIVEKGATLVLKGTVAGDVKVQAGGIFRNTGHIGGKITTEG